jgi:hypothetical protein
MKIESQPIREIGRSWPYNFRTQSIYLLILPYIKLAVFKFIKCFLEKKHLNNVKIVIICDNNHILLTSQKGKFRYIIYP